MSHTSSSRDRFGLSRQQMILASGIREAFTPFEPINDIDQLLERHREVGQLLEILLTPGRHALIFGERGVGKSSLAKVATKEILQQLFAAGCYSYSCDSSSTFEDIVCQPLADEGINIHLDQTETGITTGGTAGITTPIISVTGTVHGTTTNTYRKYRPVSPGEAQRALNERAAILVVDEADAIQNDQDKIRLAEFIKLLSDNHSKLKVMIVGIADTASALIGAHPSVQRCLGEIQLQRMSVAGLKLIIEKGSTGIGINFRSDVRDRIVYCSDGYPFFTHLLALLSGQETIASTRTTVTLLDLGRSFEEAAQRSEGSLRMAYNDAVRSSYTEMYKHVLHAASLLDGPEFTSRQLRDSIEVVVERAITQNSLNNYFAGLVSNDGTKILLRVGKGVYRFSDPRMAAHVRIVNGVRVPPNPDPDPDRLSTR